MNPSGNLAGPLIALVTFYAFAVSILGSLMNWLRRSADAD